MYKVLIADDEPTIREGLRTLIEWDKFGYRVVDTAANGKEALEKAALHSPDLIIADIRMPGMSGLELIEKLRQKESSLHVLILSGYADFDYAKKAISLQIDGYMLKPVDEDELIEYLVQLGKTLEQEKLSQQRIAAFSGLSREMIIQSMISPAGSEAAEMLHEEEVLNAGLLWDHYEIVLIKFQEIDPSGAKGTYALLKSQLAEWSELSGKGVIFSTDSYIGLLVNGDLRQANTRQNLYEDIEAIAAKHGKALIAVSGGLVKRLGDIRLSYEAGVQLMGRRFFYAEGFIAAPDDIPASALASGELLPAQLPDYHAVADKLYFAVDVGNRMAVAQLIAECLNALLAAGCTEQTIKAGLAQVVAETLAKLTRDGSAQAAGGGDYSANILELHRQPTYSSLKRYLTGFLHGLISDLPGGGIDKQMKKMIDLIERNYYENLKLESLAEIFNYNSAYLGKLFKNTTGEYFNTYLDKVRIKKAKELLDNGMKVYEVAEKVGYTNVDYFHSKFRKYEGSSPSAYRKKQF
ncbi:response regulator transcription factor [Paenibacillus nasutitermitis]|uniref:DNA-binding response regulator n=1 Tax=Paenibacillus nasutitermitis TaxID=1652958 RepID=A0A916YMI2_9BACL|nr:response regulator transcription factor [Paenibacillus nasutitermitis]GGD51575.1 DNA-binding response regulator [Paenibacillus nasutitermitis]